VRAAAGGWKVTPPIPRHDLVFEEDLVEEVARVYGYNNIPLTPLVGILELQEVDREKACERDAVRACIDLGFTEVYTNSFYGDAEIQKNSLTEKHVELENSQSEELKFLRASLLPGLLASVQKNVKQQNALRFVEGGHIFPTPASEYSAVAGVLTGERKQTFLAAKGVVERILKILSIAPAFAASHDGVDVLIHGKREGTIGHVSDPVRKAHHIPADVAFFTLNVPALAKARGNARSFIPLPNFPSVFLDLAFEVHDSVAYEDLERTIRKSGEPLLASLELFDIYEGDQIAEHHRSLAFHLVYQARDRTLTLDEAQAQHELVINALQKTFNVTRRGEHKNS
ncbi:MAG: hypothetical protein HYV34_01135, partial [Candidatus Kerfeldbacteria bacterium]|nr:hypothetical protein [Candidatus Kerfeldbacteria bacterium]